MFFKTKKLNSSRRTTSATLLIGWHGQTDRAHALHVAGGVKILNARGDRCRCTARVLQVVGAGHQNNLRQRQMASLKQLEDMTIVPEQG